MKYELFHCKNLWYLEVLGEDRFHAMAGFTTKKVAMAAYDSWQKRWGEGELKVVKTNEERTYYQWQNH